VFLRADLPLTPTDEDVDFLRRYGLRMDIDLRGDEELAEFRDALSGEDWLDYRHLPMFDRTAARGQGLAGKPSAFEPGFSWGPQYVQMAESHKEWARDVLEALAEAEGAALFHCTTGKDRTGIVSALLLGICGVSDEDIEADYCLSQCYLNPVYQRLLPRIPEGKLRSLDAPFFSTAPEHMRALLTHVGREYGGVTGYVISCGVSGAVLEKLTSRLAGSEGNTT
jgi:protein-tyrosine phosphatase